LTPVFSQDVLSDAAKTKSVDDPEGFFFPLRENCRYERFNDLPTEVNWWDSRPESPGLTGNISSSGKCFGIFLRRFNASRSVLAS